MAKQRGRKKTNNDNYFGQNEEEAVIRFLASDNQRERDKIYQEHLSAPLNKMIESIIRKYKLFRKNVSFEELHSDTLSFLLTKAHKFEASKAKKAYSYYGTICKHYVMGLLIKDERYLKHNISYDELLEESDDELDIYDEYSDTIDYTEPDNINFIKNILAEIKTVVNNKEFSPNPSNNRKTNDKSRLTDDEVKVGHMIIEILETWEISFDEMEGSNKFNKLAILSSIREGTNLSTTDIRVAMKRYKDLYVSVKNDIIENY